MQAHDLPEAAHAERDPSRSANLVDRPIGGNHGECASGPDPKLGEPGGRGRVGVANAHAVPPQAARALPFHDEEGQPCPRERYRAVIVNAANRSVHAVIRAPSPACMQKGPRQVAQTAQHACRARIRLLHHDALQHGKGEHRHKPTRNAVACTVNHRQQHAVLVAMHPPDVAAHNIARTPCHGEVRKGIARRLDVGQKRLLNTRGVANAFDRDLVGIAQLTYPIDLQVQHRVVGRDHLPDLVGGADGHALGLTLRFEPCDRARKP